MSDKSVRRVRYWFAIGSLGALNSFHVNHVKNFKMIKTSYSVVYVSDKYGRYACSAKRVGFALMNHAIQLKREVRKREHLIFWGAYKNKLIRPRCFACREFAEDMLDVYEYDKNAAYLTAALELKVISKKTFNKIMKFSKKSRLFLLGSLATVKKERIFVDGEQISEVIKQDDYLRQVWWLIVNVVNEDMARAYQSNDGVLFYWYDQLYSRTPLHLTNPESYSVKKLKIQRRGKHLQLSDNRLFPYIFQGQDHVQ